MDFEQGKKLTAKLLEQLIDNLEDQGFEPSYMMPVMLHAFFITYDLVDLLDKEVSKAGLNTLQRFIDEQKIGKGINSKWA